MVQWCHQTVHYTTGTTLHWEQCRFPRQRIKMVFNPRIPLIPTDVPYQFNKIAVSPIRLSFAMTINKAQLGYQSLKSGRCSFANPVLFSWSTLCCYCRLSHLDLAFWIHTLVHKSNPHLQTGRSADCRSGMVTSDCRLSHLGLSFESPWSSVWMSHPCNISSTSNLQTNLGLYVWVHHSDKVVIWVTSDCQFESPSKTVVWPHLDLAFDSTSL